MRIPADPLKSALARLRGRRGPNKPRDPNKPRNFGDTSTRGRLPGDKRTTPVTIQEKHGQQRNLIAKKSGYKVTAKRKPSKPHTPEAVAKILEMRQVQELARTSARAAMKALDDIVNSKLASDLARISAANALLDRGYGKALQTNVNATVNTDGNPKEIDGKELDRRVKETISNIEGLTKRTREKIKSPDGSDNLRKLN